MRSRTWGKDCGRGVPSGMLTAPLATLRDSRVWQRGGKGRRAMGASLWAGFERPSSHFRVHQNPHSTVTGVTRRRPRDDQLHALPAAPERRQVPQFRRV